MTATAPDAEFRKTAPRVALGPVLPSLHLQEATLTNGMAVVVVERPEVPVVSLIWASRAAHDDGTPEHAGLATAAAITSVESTRHDLNVETADDGLFSPVYWASQTGTFFQVVTLTPAWQDALSKLAVLVRAPVKPGRDGDRVSTRRAALARIPDVLVKVRRLAREAVWGKGAPAALAVDGDGRAFKGFDDAAIGHFKERTYRPSDSVLIVVGPVSLPLVLERARESFDGWGAPTAPVSAEIVETKAAEMNSERPRITAVQTRSGPAFLSISSACTGAMDADDVAFEVLTNLLESSAPSHGLGMLRARHGYNYYLHANCKERRRAGTFSVEFDATPAVVEPALRAALDGLARLGTSEVSDADLEHAKMRFLGRWQDKLSSSPGIGRAIAAYFQEGLTARDIATLEERVRAVTAPRLREVARRYLAPSRLSIVAAGVPDLIDRALQRVGTVTWVNEVDPKDFPSEYWDELRDAGN